MSLKPHFSRFLGAHPQRLEVRRTFEAKAGLRAGPTGPSGIQSGSSGTLGTRPSDSGILDTGRAGRIGGTSKGEPTGAVPRPRNPD